MQHLAVLEKIKVELEGDSNVLAVLVFGSVADNTYHHKSDIDLSVIYQDFTPGFEFSTNMAKEIKVGYSKWSLQRLNEKVATSPYRMYVFAHAKLIFDKANIKNIQEYLINFFSSHPDIQKEWDEINEDYKQEKIKYGAGQTNIFDVYAELDKKYGNLF